MTATPQERREKRPDNLTPHTAETTLGPKTVTTRNGQDVRYYPTDGEAIRGVRKKLLTKYAEEFFHDAQTRVSSPISSDKGLEEHINATRMRYQGKDPMLPERELDEFDRQAAAVSLLQGLVQKLIRTNHKIIEKVEWRMGETGKEYFDIIKEEQKNKGEVGKLLETATECYAEGFEILADEKNVLLRGGHTDKENILITKLGEIYKISFDRLKQVMEKRYNSISTTMGEIDEVRYGLNDLCAAKPALGKKLSGAIDTLATYAKERVDTLIEDEAIYTAAGEGFDAAARRARALCSSLRRVSGTEKELDAVDYGISLIVNMAHLGVPHIRSLDEFKARISSLEQRGAQRAAG